MILSIGQPAILFCANKEIFSCSSAESSSKPEIMEYSLFKTNPASILASSLGLSIRFLRKISHILLKNQFIFCLQIFAEPFFYKF